MKQVNEAKRDKACAALGKALAAVLAVKAQAEGAEIKEFTALTAGIMRIDDLLANAPVAPKRERKTATLAGKGQKK